MDRQSCACNDAGLELSVGGERNGRENRDRQQWRDKPLHLFSCALPNLAKR